MKIISKTNRYDSTVTYAIIHGNRKYTYTEHLRQVDGVDLRVVRCKDEGGKNVKDSHLLRQIHSVVANDVVPEGRSGLALTVSKATAKL